MKIITKAIEKAFNKQGDTAQKNASEINIICKLFNPCGAATWWLYEHIEGSIYMCFATLGDSRFAECGTVDLEELKSLRVGFGLSIERDRWYTSETLEHLIKRIKE